MYNIQLKMLEKLKIYVEPNKNFIIQIGNIEN